jgi:sporulation protein YlmC with PRC-barrel domain
LVQAEIFSCPFKSSRNTLMIRNTLLAFTAAVSLASLQPALAQQSMDGVDPTCVMTGADGVKSVDMTKCPDGKTPSMAQAPGDAATPAPDASATAPAPATPATDATATAPAATTSPDMGLVVPGEMLTAGSVMTASDYIGKRVYDASGNDIGEVNDIILSSDGKMAATILGVGGFLGIGEKDVAVPVGAVKIMNDGNTARLQIAATKEQLQAAPSYDRKSRTYLN